ncbi:hypothetical protein JK222_12385 [Gluconobacter cerinus]|uniref:hypothetical protein n=1 Tax=Gluconobacter cerinus TaxID=38307 RepID=UPI001B8D978D|nr:hypothetical protein [Gluconobacter cerinus]MBS1072484.1 hypothetical protein [Gluconobacter cerinus]MCW2266185.1 hypothetical protein [Gluconobacter cerinus]
MPGLIFHPHGDSMCRINVTNGVSLMRLGIQMSFRNIEVEYDGMRVTGNALH